MIQTHAALVAEARKYGSRATTARGLARAVLAGRRYARSQRSRHSRLSRIPTPYIGVRLQGSPRRRARIAFLALEHHLCSIPVDAAGHLLHREFQALLVAARAEMYLERRAECRRRRYGTKLADPRRQSRVLDALLAAPREERRELVRRLAISPNAWNLVALALATCATPVREEAEKYAVRAVALGYALVSYSRPDHGGWRYADVHLLIGEDEGQLFTHRIPATILSVEEALRYMRPAACSAGGAEIVYRQGDIWAVGRPGDGCHAEIEHDAALAGTRHTVAAREGHAWLELLHTGHEHAPLILLSGYIWSFYRARQVQACGD